MSSVSSETTTLLVGFCAKLSNILLARANTSCKPSFISISFSSGILAGLARAGIYGWNWSPWGKRVSV